MDKTIEEELEKLAEEVHNSWMEEKIKQGFHAPFHHNYDKSKFGKFEKQCNKCHTDLYPYNELPENIKEYDRVTVRTVIKAQQTLQSLPVSDAVEFITWVHKYYGYDYKKEYWFSLDDLLGEEPQTHGELYLEFKLSKPKVSDVPENKWIEWYRENWFRSIEMWKNEVDRKDEEIAALNELINNSTPV